MSQEKVDYKQLQKSRRRNHVKEEKRNRFFGWLIGIIVVGGLVSWIAYSINKLNVNDALNNPEQLTITIDSLSEYLSSIDTDEEEEEHTHDEDEESEEDADSSEDDSEDSESSDEE